MSIILLESKDLNSIKFDRDWDLDLFSGENENGLFCLLGVEQDVFFHANECLINKGMTSVGVFVCSYSEFSFYKQTNLDGHEQPLELRDDSEVTAEIVQLLSLSARKNASDIHIFCEGDVARISFRIDGLLEHNSKVTSGYAADMCAVMFNTLSSSKDENWSANIPQDADVRIKYDPEDLKVRYSHMPTVFNGIPGFHATLRLLKNNSLGTLSKGGLGLNITSFEENEIIDNIVNKNSGLIIVAGVTGSGKSTTIKHILEYLNHKHKGKKNILTLEDPIEYVISGAVQTPISSKNIDGFDVALKSVMRADPDILMIGEVRSKDTLKAIMYAVESGHLSITSLHSASIVGVLQRLVSLGLNPKQLSIKGTLAGIICQRLIRKPCQACHRGSVPGCSNCYGAGYLGRQLVVEYYYPEREHLKMISECDWNSLQLSLEKEISGNGNTFARYVSLDDKERFLNNADF